MNGLSDNTGPADIRGSIPTPGWRLKPFIIGLLGVSILSAAFFPDISASMWKPVDEAFFRALNGTIVEKGAWTTIVAWANTRVFDNLWAGVMGILCLRVLFTPKYGAFNERFALIFTITLTVALGVIISKTGFKHYDRLSPGLALEGINNLNAMLPDIKAKVGSNSSFPGDHGVASILFAASFIYFMRAWPNIVIAAILIGVVNVLPRLIGGGHWLSDAIIGGGLAGCVGIPFLIASPYLYWIGRATKPVTERILRPLMEKAGFGRIAV